MSNERLPIKFFAPREIDELKVEPGGSSDVPNWVLEGKALEQRATELCQAFEQFSEPINERAKRNSAVPFVFIAKMCDDATAKSRRGDISALFQSGEKSNVIGLTAADELVVKIDSVSQMNEISSRLTDYQRNRYAISCLETFWEFQPEIDFIEHDSVYKVKLIDFQDYETNVAMQRLFEQALNSRKIKYQKSNYTNQFSVYKINMAPNAILDALYGDDAYEMLFSIEPMPKYVVSLDLLKNETPVDILRPLSETRYEILGILDNGIAPIPHLTP